MGVIRGRIQAHKGAARPPYPGQAIVGATVGVYIQQAQYLGRMGGHAPAPVPARGLLDTGASCTVIDESIVQALGLTPSNFTTITFPGSDPRPVTRDTYDVIVALDDGTSPAVNYHVEAAGGVLSRLGFEMLIGYDILCRCGLAYHGRLGRFRLGF